MLNKTKIWTFRGFSPSQSFSTANLLHLTFRVSTKVQHFFSRDPTILFKKNQNLHRLSNFTVSVAFYGTFSTFNNLQFWEKSNICFEKPIYLLNKTQILIVFSNFVFSIAFCIEFATFSDFWRNQVFLVKNPCFFLKKTKSENFKKFLKSQSVSSATFLPVKFSGFKKRQHFFSKNPSTFF